MRILLLNYEFPPFGGGGGKATYNLARELTRLGHQVDVLTARLKNQTANEKIDGFTIYRVRSWRRGVHDCGFRGALTFVLFAVSRFIRLARQNRYDVIHYFFGLPTGLLSLLPEQHRKIPYVISLRGSDVPGYDKYNKPLEKVHRLLLPVTRRIWKKAEQVIALSESLKTTAHQSVPCLQIHVIPNGVDSLFLAPIPLPDKIKNGFKMIAVARLIERKGLQDVLQALSQLQDPEISLLIVGTGNYENQLKKLCNDLSLQTAVSFHGFCHSENLPGLLRRHDIFILTSLAESFGNAFAEAMACGLPIIGSDIGGIPDFVGDDNGILVPPGNVTQIKNAILKLKNSKKLQTKMQQANRAKMMESYSWKTIAKQHIRIYQDAIRNGK